MIAILNDVSFDDFLYINNKVKEKNTDNFVKFLIQTVTVNYMATQAFNQKSLSTDIKASVTWKV